MASGSLTGFVIEFQSATVKHLKQLCAKLTEREVILCEQVAELVAHEIVVTTPIVSYAFWFKLCKSRIEVYEQNGDSIKNGEISEEEEAHNVAA
ncbi:hypothetical protein KY290_011927 [Solanum tuberosum]|uniref:Uncharacterized protein n=1 Tax=Solanum tuberosum TaxID=4113 RepID=A0ABQ7W240_SOLTU|nr:hypothetical protein KY289_012450 [Solanum tuberosum]KAH0710586.1 hypothetical protein KY284_012013 [Solanum tuberosum]KAH0774790.1 hypothetical protein KY290_011927 [Solanum tuberosum]